MNDTERRALALTGAGDIVFDWDVVSDNIFVSPEVEHQLGLKRGSLEGPASAWLDLIHPFDKDRYRARPRRGDRAAPRPPDPGFPPALRLRRASLVPPQGASGDRLRRRGAAHRRHARRRHGQQDRRGAPAARRRARQPDEPAEPAALLRPPGSRPHLREPGRCPAPHRARHRHRQAQGDQRPRRLCGRRFDPAHPVAPPRAACSSRRIPWRASPATNSPSSCCPSASPTASSPSPTWSGAW